MIPRRTSAVGDRIYRGSWTPTWSTTGTSPSIGNGTLSGEYELEGTRLTFTIRLVWGSTTTGGTSAWGFSLPPNVTSLDILQVVPCVAEDNGSTAFRVGHFLVAASGTSCFPGYTWASSTDAIDVDSPQTWAQNDTLTISGTILIAP